MARTNNRRSQRPFPIGAAQRTSRYFPFTMAYDEISMGVVEASVSILIAFTTLPTSGPATNVTGITNICRASPVGFGNSKEAVSPESDVTRNGLLERITTERVALSPGCRT